MLLKAGRKAAIRALWLAPALAVAALISSPAAAGTVAVNAATSYQTIDGFGAACVYHTILSSEAPILWADDSSSLVSDAAAHVNGHVGLSILRTRIDETEETAGTGVWTGSSDVAAMKLALAQNPSILIFSSEWSPPNADKENGQENGGSANNCFLGLPTTNDGTAGSAAADTDYANYLVKYAQTIKNSEGITLYAVSPQNESDYNTSYESCLWTGPQFETFIGSYLGPAWASAGLTATKIMITESFKNSLALAANTMDDAAAADYVGILAGHLYGSPEPPATLASANFTHLTNQHYWETEIANLGSSWDATMAIGLQEAQWIHNCIVDAGMNAYNHWSLNSTTEDAFYNSNTGQWSTACYVEGNYSKFIRKGFIRVSATEFPSGGTGTGTGAPVWCSAYVSSSLNRVVVVAVNNSTSTQAETFNLTGLASVPQVAPWLTSSSANLVQQSLVTVSGNSFSYTLPAQSVVTFVGDCTAGSPTSTDTPTGTATPAKSPTSTGTRTSTLSPTSTSTRTSTLSPSPALTSSSTATPSASPTLSKSPTGSPSASPSITLSKSPTGTYSVSPTETASPTASPTRTVTATASATGTLSDSPTLKPTGSATDSPTASASPSPSPTAADSATLTATPTATASATPTQTASPTATSSASPTEINTQTASDSGTPTFSPTATPSATAVQSSATPTATATAEPTSTDTATASASPSASATAAPLGGPLRILGAVPVPNPNPDSLELDLEGPADRVLLGVFTEALVQVRQADIPVRMNAGWNHVPLGSALKSLPLGLYFVRAQATRAGAASPAVIVKVLITRR
jgi:O-glycosyl hydrolase